VRGTLRRMANSPPDLKARLDLAIAAAREAGELTLKYYRSAELQVDHKADASPVTQADREAEQLLRQRISEKFPDDAILGEEFGAQDGKSGYRWILDPIDGTKSFVSGVGLYTTLIGVQFEGESVIGVISSPASHELISAAAGQGAWYTDRDNPPQRARVSTKTNLAESLFVTTDVSSFDDVDAHAAYRHLESAVRLSRTWGDGYGYLLVATGRAEIMVDPELNEWDAAAILPVLVEAGGRFTDWSGQARINGGNGVGTNGHLHEDVLAMLSDR
jgi:histidinol-phosphatase